MFEAMKRLRDSRDDRGFTLIELMVVVLIIAILIAIAIPTFLGARTKAQERAAQVDARQGLLTAKAYYTDKETFLSGLTMASTASAYQALEPSLTFSDTPSQTAVGVMVASLTEVVLVKKSKSNTWFCLGESTSTATVYGKSSAATNPFTTLASCTGGW